MKLHHQIFLAMILGGLAGWVTSEDTRILGIAVIEAYDLIGTLFINALKMLVVPPSSVVWSTSARARTWAGWAPRPCCSI